MATWTPMVMILSYLLQKSNGNMAILSPSPEALVKEGETIDLRCDYIGVHYPDYINWYLNIETQSLVIDTTNCIYQAKPEVYRTYNLSSSCNGSSFTLSIANISKAKDDGDIWKCDATIINGSSPSKASTRIRVIEIVKMGNDRVFSSESHIVVVIIAIVFAGLLITVSAVFVYWKNRKGKKDETNDQRNGEDTNRALNRPTDSEEQEDD